MASDIEWRTHSLPKSGASRPMPGVSSGGDDTGGVPGSKGGAAYAGRWWACDAQLAVGECVYISADDTVDACDSTDSTKMPCIGIAVVVRTKADATKEAFVGQSGLLDDTISGLTQDTAYYVSATGTLDSSEPAGADRIVQCVGRAKSATAFAIDIGIPFRYGSP